MLSKKIEETNAKRNEDEACRGMQYTEVDNTCRISYISRTYYDQNLGAEFLKRVIIGDIDGDLIAKYTVLAGVYCLLRYIENCTGTSYAAHSLRLEYCSSSSGRLNIDRKTALSLELIINSSGNNKECLFGIINNTKTTVGARLLKSNILRPHTDAVTIETRLDLVELLLKGNKKFSEIVRVLTLYPDLDKLLTGLTTIPKKQNAKTAKLGIDTLISLKETLLVSNQLYDALAVIEDNAADAGQTSHMAVLLRTILANIKNDVFFSLLETINTMLLESTKYSKSPIEMRQQECFAINSGVDGVLDISRKSYVEFVEEIYQICDNYNEVYNNTVAMKVVYTAARGYFLSIPSSLMPLPSCFIQPVTKGKAIHCSTEEITSLSCRATAALDKAVIITNELIQSCLEFIRKHLDSLFLLVDSVALLDMLISFADLVALSPMKFVRPTVTATGPLVIEQGRHPIIAVLNVKHNTSFVPNNVFLSSTDNMQVITGANGAGKTVYIKQIALIVIMAQIGCYVPAVSCSIPMRDRILSRLGNKDDLEHNMSTFYSEMRECSYILTNVTDKSLIIIDELGRGTSNNDGCSIAFAFAEHLLDCKAYTLFVTHYSQCTSLPLLYPNAKNIHFKTSINTVASNSANASRSGLIYSHQLDNGPYDMNCGYGIVLAEIAMFPEVITRDARAIKDAAKRVFPTILNCARIDAFVDVLYKILRDIMVSQNALLVRDPNYQQLSKYYHVVQSNIPKQSREEILQQLEYMLAVDGASSVVASEVEEVAMQPTVTPTPVTILTSPDASISISATSALLPTASPPAVPGVAAADERPSDYDTDTANDEIYGNEGLVVADENSHKTSPMKRDISEAQVEAEAFDSISPDSKREGVQRKVARSVD